MKQGEPPFEFYVIERGEVEVIRNTDKDPGGEVVRVLGPGSFFGEKALLNDEQPRVSSARARTAVEVVVMGKNVFTQVSGALGPLRDALAQTLNRRAINVWKDNPAAHELLQRTLIKKLMEPAPQPLLNPPQLCRRSRVALSIRQTIFFTFLPTARLLMGL